MVSTSPTAEVTMQPTPGLTAMPCYARTNRAGPGGCKSTFCFSLSPLSRLAHSQYSPIELETASPSTRHQVEMHEVKSEQLLKIKKLDSSHNTLYAYHNA